jgi:hypothetical protein
MHSISSTVNRIVLAVRDRRGMLNIASPKTIRGAADLRAAVGKELGISSWYEVTQDRVTAFADATGDQYWIQKQSLPASPPASCVSRPADD